MSPIECACVPAKIGAVHAYLRVHFRHGDLLDFHAPVRLMQAGLPPPHNGHHVVRVLDGEEYYTIITHEFQDSSTAEMTRLLCQWDLATFLRHATIVILGRSGIAPLQPALVVPTAEASKR